MSVRPTESRCFKNWGQLSMRHGAQSGGKFYINLNSNSGESHLLLSYMLFKKIFLPCAKLIAFSQSLHVPSRQAAFG